MNCRWVRFPAGVIPILAQLFAVLDVVSDQQAVAAA
jgi:hypothetical protein